MPDPSNPPTNRQFLELPTELQEQILAELDLANLVRMAQTNHHLRDIALATIFTRRGTEAELFQLDWLMNYLYQNPETLSPETRHKLCNNMIKNLNEVESETLKTLYEVFIERVGNREVNDAQATALTTPPRYLYHENQNLIRTLETIIRLPEATCRAMLTELMREDNPVSFQKNHISFYTLILLQHDLTQEQKDELLKHAARILSQGGSNPEPPQIDLLEILYTMRHNPLWKEILRNIPLGVAVFLIETTSQFKYLEMDPELRLKLITNIISAHMHSVDPKDIVTRCQLIGAWLEQGLSKITNPELAENVRFVSAMLNFGNHDTPIGPLLAPLLEVYLATLRVGMNKDDQTQVIKTLYQGLIRHINYIHELDQASKWHHALKASVDLCANNANKAAISGKKLGSLEKEFQKASKRLEEFEKSLEESHDRFPIPLDQSILNATLPLTIIIHAILPLLSDAEVANLLATLPRYFSEALPSYFMFEHQHITKSDDDAEVRSPAHGAWLQITAEPRFQNFITQQIAAAKLEDLETQLIAAEALADASVNEPSSQALVPELEAARNNAFAALEKARAEISAMVANYLTMLEQSIRRANKLQFQLSSAGDHFIFLVIYQEQLKSIIHFFHHYFNNHRYDKFNLMSFVNILLNCDGSFRFAFSELITNDYHQHRVLSGLECPETICMIHEELRAILNDMVAIAKETLSSTEIDKQRWKISPSCINLKKSLGGAEAVALWQGLNLNESFEGETDNLLGLNIQYLIENVFPLLDNDTLSQFIHLIKNMSKDNLRALVGYLNLSIHGYINDAELRTVLPQLTSFEALEDNDFPSPAQIDRTINSLERLLAQTRNVETENVVHAALRNVVDAFVQTKIQDYQQYLNKYFSLNMIKFSGDEVYWYQDQDMNDFLMAAVGDRANVVAPLHPFETTYLRENRARFQEYLVDAIRNPDRNTLPTVIPINVTDEAHSAGDGMIGRHWVGMMVQYDQATNQVNITLVDPRGNGLDQDITYDPDDINPANYLTQLAELAHHTIQNNLETNVRININIPHQRQQTNDHDCGPWTVANLTNLVAGVPLETNPAAVRAIRRRQGGIAEPQAAAEEANGRQKRRETSPISAHSHFSDRSAKRRKNDEAAEASDDENQAKRKLQDGSRSSTKRPK